METGDCVDLDGVVSLFPEVEEPPAFVPRVRIDRLRRLMLTFADMHVLVGVGPFVASRLDLDADLRYGTSITMLHVYFTARAVRLIVDRGGREMPDADFVRRARGLHVVRCDTCGVGEYESENGRCWMCDAHEERCIVAGAAATC